MEPTIEEGMGEPEEEALENPEIDNEEIEFYQEFEEIEVKDEPDSPDESLLWYEDLAIDDSLLDLSQEDIEMLLDIKTEPDTTDYDAQENAAENAQKEEPKMKQEPEF